MGFWGSAGLCLQEAQPRVGFSQGPELTSGQYILITLERHRNFDYVESPLYDGNLEPLGLLECSRVKQYLNLKSASR